MEYPLNDVLPNIEHSRDRLLARVFEYRRGEERMATDVDFELIYAYGKSSRSHWGEGADEMQCWLQDSWLRILELSSRSWNFFTGHSTRTTSGLSKERVMAY